MKEILITTLVEKALEEVKKFGYCDNSYKIFEYHYKNLLKYYQEKNIKYYSYNVSIQFLRDKHNIDIKKGHFNYWQSRKCRAIKILNDVFNDEEIKIKYVYNQLELNNENAKLLDEYITYNTKLGLSQKNITGIKQFTIRFLNYLEINNLIIAKLQLQDINKYLSTLTKINNVTKKNYLFMIKQFLKYLFDKQIISINLGEMLPNMRKPKNSNLPSIWSFEELNQLLNSIDTATSMGKRDYAIIVLALTSTLRGSDIISMKLKNIDFNNNLIRITQQKTKNEIIIPLMDKAKVALLDYINNGRPQHTNYENIFLSCRETVKPIMNTGALSSMIYRYSRKLEFKHNQKRGIHSLRHTTLNYLFNDSETSLTTITEISGHCNPDSLNSYIKTDINRLSEFTLNINDFGDKNA